jgi:hypothetical protein
MKLTSMVQVKTRMDALSSLSLSLPSSAFLPGLSPPKTKAADYGENEGEDKDLYIPNCCFGQVWTWHWNPFG